MTLRSLLGLGPSKFDRLLDVLQTEQAASRAEREATQTLLASFLDGNRAATELLRKQYDLWTAPAGEPMVRLMTPAVEARLERERTAKQAKAHTPADLDSLLDQLGRDFRTESSTFQ